MALEDNKKNSAETEEIESEEKNLALELGSVIQEEIKKAKEDIKAASEKISALEEMTAIQKVLLHKENRLEKKYSLKYHITSMIKNAIEIVKVPKTYNQIEEEQRENVISKLEEILKEIYPYIPEKIYDPKESIDHQILAKEKMNLKDRIMDYLNKREGEISQEKIDYAERLSKELEIMSLVYGKETAVIILINNMEKIYPNTQKTSRVEKILAAIKEKYE